MASQAYTSSSWTASPSNNPSNTNSMKAVPDGLSPEHIARHLAIKRVMPMNRVNNQLAKKQKVAASPSNVAEYDEDDEVAAAAAQAALAGISETKPKLARKTKGDESEEKRLKRFRAKPPLTYLARLDRVKTQRMFLIDRNRSTSEDGTHEQEAFDIAGSTGNVYQVTISKVPTCSCPDAAKGNQCKHIIYVLVNVLKAREDLAYQLAFLAAELVEIFTNAPFTPQSDEGTASTTDPGSNRKPIEGDCPICVMEFDESDKVEDIVWCKAACGNNVHRLCFEQWAKSKPGEVKCVYCRTPWEGDEDSIKRISKGGRINDEGYVNVAGELGLSGHRDMSTYHPYWVQRVHGGGRYGRNNGW
ncbi:Uncharacterized protein BP5553_05235 [Venustampulla echinocandica]|uniref:RING protein n=1 Tax=Venustampulla echinocandica TaxID=2656787 RepID=A0A370TQL2_9HELO|nr:Uncharacterized protein BP5553_05235 [Venustampulla echinocandica]RDL37802.1 Uncharacterized protein BP5553_05235 [Venustampulla echinocandica]